MPVRSLNSPVLKWPRRDEVKKALMQWLNKQVATYPEIIQLGYFGSLAKDNWGVGSDLDLIVIIQDSSIPFEKRGSFPFDGCWPYEMHCGDTS